MANLTIAVDDDTLRRARIRAAEQGTSVNAVLREELTRYASTLGAEHAADTFLRIAEESAGRSADGERWTREGLYLDRSALS